MGVSKRNPWLYGLGVLLAVLVAYPGQVRADVTSDTPGSIVIYPKVIADGTRDTLIQLTNTSNMGTSAHCWYFDASPCGNPDPNISSHCCQPNNFFVDLTPQQPIFWRASTGRFTSETRCNSGVDNYKVCASAIDCSPGVACQSTPGIFLGNVPPRINFQGELKCIQVDSVGVPVAGNSLKGEALLETLADGQVSEYNAIAVQGSANPSPVCSGGPLAGRTCGGQADCCDIAGLCGTCAVQLKLDNTTYNACPRDLLATHYAQGASDLYTGAIVNSEITLVPCTEDIENDRPIGPTSIPVIANFRVVDEIESQALSGAIPFTCWLNVALDDVRLGGIYNSSTVGTFVKTKIPTTTGAPNVGLIGVIEEFHKLGTSDPGTAAANLHGQGSRTGGDVITIPQQTGSN
jgi:hypothetical protein